MDKKFYPPPTSEQWQRVPTWLKLKIVVILTWYSIPLWLAEIGLKIGGQSLIQTLQAWLKHARSRTASRMPKRAHRKPQDELFSRSAATMPRRIGASHG